MNHASTRGFHPDIGEVDAQTGLPPSCRRCGSRPASLQTYMYVMSFLLFTRHASYQDLLCRDCATHRALGEQAKSALLGWWGIPWGLLTFKALWINARTLLRWSRLSAPLAGLAGLAGLIVPVALGAWIYTNHQESERARALGDYVPQEVSALFDQAWQQYAGGDVEAALASLEKAHAQAPESRSINSSLAMIYRSRGEPARALPYAARAAEVNSTGYGDVALHGLVLAELGREAEARRIADRVDALLPGDTDEFGWGVLLHGSLEDHEQVLQMLDAHPRWVEEDSYLRLARLEALTELDRPDEVGSLLAGLPEEDLQDSRVVFFQMVHHMRTSPQAAVQELTTEWSSTSYSPVAMQMLARAAERAGALEAARARIRDWLATEQAPEEAWFGARPWFTGATWREALAAHVARRPDFVPSYLLLQELDPMLDRRQRNRLADDLRRREHPLAEMCQALYFDSLDLPRSERLRRLEDHVTDDPDATCLAMLVREYEGDSPAKAQHFLGWLEKLAADDPCLQVVCEFYRCEELIGADQAEQALARLADLQVDQGRPYLHGDSYELLCAQAAFIAGHEPELRVHLDPLLADRQSSCHTAALVLHWCEQLALGLPMSYRADVDAWLRDSAEKSRSSSSTSAQAILLAEGRVDADWAKRASGERSPDTLDLVRELKRLADQGAGDLSGLRAVADSPRHRGFAPTLARAILARLES